MAKTARDVCTEALRHIRVLAVFEEPEAEDFERAKAHLDAIFVELDDTEELALEWTVETVPDGAFLPLSRMLAGSIAPSYGRMEYAGERKAGEMAVKAYEATRSITGRPIKATYF